MMDIASEQFWNAKFEEKKKDKPKKKISFENKIIMVGLIVFTICTGINTALIYTFFNTLNKL